MIDYETAKNACETYVRSLENSDLETLLDLFADDASIEDPVGTICAKERTYCALSTARPVRALPKPN